jgi:hypothetical protein
MRWHAQPASLKALLPFMLPLCRHCAATPLSSLLPCPLPPVAPPLPWAGCVALPCSRLRGSVLQLARASRLQRCAQLPAWLRAGRRVALAAAA